MEKIPQTASKGEWGWEVDFDPTDACKGSKMVGTVHTHPEKDLSPSWDDLMRVNDLGPSCILARDKDNLKAACYQNRGGRIPYKGFERRLLGKDRRPLEFDYCVTDIAKGSVRRWRLPWKAF